MNNIIKEPGDWGYNPHSIDEIKPPDVIKEPFISRFDIIRNMLQNQFNTGAVSHLGNGYFHIELPAITCTGSDITQYFIIPFKHKLHQFIMKHTDSSDVDSNDALTYNLKQGLGQLKPNLFIAVQSVSATVISDTVHLYSDLWRSQLRYQLISNTTNTDKLYASLIIEIEDEPERGE